MQRASLRAQRGPASAGLSSNMVDCGSLPYAQDVGSSHAMTTQTAELDLDLIAALRDAVADTVTHLLEVVSG